MKKFLLICLTILIIVFAACPVYAIEQEEREFEIRDLRLLEDRITQVKDRMVAAHDMAEAARKLGFNEDHIIVKIAKTIYEEAYISYCKNKNNYDIIKEKWNIKELEYPIASKVWLTLVEAGYNDQVIAGIIGNMMVECGGQTLNLKPTAKTSYYYGVCQWSRSYSEVWDTNLEYQLQFLLSTINYELDTYGYFYKKGFDYNAFLKIEDTKEAALAFSKCYERCSPVSYKTRQKCAEIAYNYFIL